jgi:hypothetical protein
VAEGASTQQNMTPQTIRKLAANLDQAERTNTQIRQFSLEYPEISIDDAYAIQKAWVALKLERGRVIKGHKIGLTSKAMQSSFDIGEPDYGALLDDMFFGDAAELPMSRFIAPRLEVELAFVLGKSLKGPNCTIFDVLIRRGLRYPGGRDYRHPDTRGRSRNQGHAQGHRHHIRQCRQCCSGTGRASVQTQSGRYALDFGAVLPQRSY